MRGFHWAVSPLSASLVNKREEDTEKSDID